MRPSVPIKFFGSQAKTGKALGMTQQTISYWVNVLGKVPDKYVPYIKFLMGRKK